jgi:hypothetical protein
MSLCECGCGQEAPVASRTSAAKGWVKGEPLRFVHGHSTRGKKRPDSAARIAAINRARTRHGHTVNRERSPTWISWRNMHARCADPANPSWEWYGGRGITVCEAVAKLRGIPR